MTEGEFVVIGAEYNPGGPPFALLARQDEEGLTYAGSAFVTLGAAEREAFWSPAALTTPKPVLRDLPRKEAFWCRPEPAAYVPSQERGAPLGWREMRFGIKAA